MTSIIATAPNNTISSLTTTTTANTTSPTKTASAALIMKDLRAIEEEKGIVVDTTTATQQQQELELGVTTNTINNNTPAKLKQIHPPPSSSTSTNHNIITTATTTNNVTTSSATSIKSTTSSTKSNLLKSFTTNPSRMLRKSPAGNATTTNHNQNIKKSDAARSTSSAITPKTTSLDGEDDNSSDILLLSSSPYNYNHRRSKSDEFLQLALGPAAATTSSTSGAIVTSSSVREQHQKQHHQEDKLHNFAKQQVARSSNTDTNNTLVVTPQTSSGVIYQSSDPEKEEQILFDQRLCEDTLGVAVRKINSNGKSQLRYVKCIALEAVSVCTADNKSHFSFGKIGRHKKSDQAKAHSSTGGYDTNEYQVETQSMSLLQNSNMKRTRALTWGNKNKVRIHLSSFVSVRKGKTTERTKKNVAPASHLLSLITSDKDHLSLDLEAPTRLDRDKFARAFARFLDVPLEIEQQDVKYSTSRTVDYNVMTSHKTASPLGTTKKESKRILSAAQTEPGMSPYQKMIDKNHTSYVLPAISSAGDTHNTARPPADLKQPPATAAATPSTLSSAKDYFYNNPPQANQNSKPKEVSAAALKRIQGTEDQPIIDLVPLIPTPQTNNPTTPTPNNKNTLLSPTNITSTKSRPSTSKQKPKNHKAHVDSDGELSSVSSLTAGFDHEIVDELHQVIHELRAELESSRAEAARAVKVAEQAIQSAESCTSKDWNSTVTHKAAEAAAQAQKRSAEAMARQRFAEERLASERKSAAFWRKQAELAEEEAGVLHTRAAVSEVTRGVLEEKIQSERRSWNRYIHNLQLESSSLETSFMNKFADLQNQQSQVEFDLQSKQNDITHKEEEVKVLRDALMERINNSNSVSSPNFVRKRKGLTSMFSRRTLKGSEEQFSTSSSTNNHALPIVIQTYPTPPRSASRHNPTTTKNLLTLHSEIQQMKYQYTLFRQQVICQIQSYQIPIGPFMQLLHSSQEEVTVLRNKLAQENTMRRRLSHEVQDLRGSVRVYCRPVPRKDKNNHPNVVQITSPQMIVLHRDVSSSRSFEFDRVLPPDTTQSELYDEMEEMVLGSLDGYAVCIMAHGQRNSGKTYSIIGDTTSSSDSNTSNKYDGIFFQALSQLVTISTKRKDRYKDVFTISIVEVHGDRLLDFCAGTTLANTSGQIISDTSSKDNNNKQHTSLNQKLEIRTNYDGDTIVQGLISIPISSLEEAISLWQDCIKLKQLRVQKEQNHNSTTKEQDSSSSHMIITITSTSTNIATGVGTVGKLVFVDLASSNVQLKRSTTAANFTSSSTSANSNKHSTTSMDIASILSPIYPQSITPGMEYKFVNKSLSTLCDVVVARSSYARSVPYRNSTLTHLLRDYLEGDAKVLLLCCISCENENLQETFTALRFASKMKRIEIGKATKHTLSLA